MLFLIQITYCMWREPRAVNMTSQTRSQVAGDEFSGFRRLRDCNFALLWNMWQILLTWWQINWCHNGTRQNVRNIFIVLVYKLSCINAIMLCRVDCFRFAIKMMFYFMNIYDFINTGKITHKIEINIKTYHINNLHMIKSDWQNWRNLGWTSAEQRTPQNFAAAGAAEM